jgi:hypothetical protein
MTLMTGEGTPPLNVESELLFLGFFFRGEKSGRYATKICFYPADP